MENIVKRLALLLFCFIAGCLIGFGAGYILPVSVEGKWEQAEAEKKSESPDTAAKSVQSKANDSGKTETEEKSVSSDTLDTAAKSVQSKANDSGKTETKKAEKKVEIPLSERPMIKMINCGDVVCNELKHDYGFFCFTIPGAMVRDRDLALFSVNEKKPFVPEEVRLRVGPFVLERCLKGQADKIFQNVTMDNGVLLKVYPNFFLKYQKMKIFLIPIFGMVFMLIGKLLCDFGGKILRCYIKKTDETLSSFPESTQFGIFFFHCCVSLYAAFVLSLYAMAPVWSIPFLFLWCFFLISQQGKFLRKIQIPNGLQLNQDKKVTTIWGYAAIFLPQYFAYWMFVCRGTFHNDPMGPYFQQVNFGTFWDWHPIMHTFFNLAVMKIIPDFAFVVLVELMLFAFGVSYVCASLRKFGFSGRAVALTAAFMVFNPFMLVVQSYPWKDSVFLSTGIFVIGFMVHLFMTNGQWLRKNRNMILFVLLVTYLSLVRHNGIMFTVILLAAMLIALPCKKRVCFAALSCCFLCFLIKVPLYRYGLKVKPRAAEEYRIEAFGVPMTMLGGYMQSAPEMVPEKMRIKLEKMASYQQWHEEYVYGDFNVWKQKNRNIDSLTEFWKNTLPDEVLKAVSAAFYKKPRIAAGSFAVLTNVAFSLIPTHTVAAQGPDDAQRVVEQFQGMRGDEPEIVELLRFPVLFEKWVRFLAGIWKYSIFHVIFGCGAAMMLLLIVGFSTLNRYGWKNIMLVLPCLSLTAGTALLLTGCESRFFYLTSLQAPVFILLMLSRKQEVSEEADK